MHRAENIRDGMILIMLNFECFTCALVYKFKWDYDDTRTIS